MKVNHFRQILAIGIGLFLAGRSTAGQFVELTVELESDDWAYHLLAPDRRVISSNRGEELHSIFTNHRTLHCIVGTNAWLIEAEPGNLVLNSKVMYWFTGTNIVEHYVVTLVPKEPLAQVPGSFVGSYPPVGARSTRIWASADGNPGRGIGEADIMPQLGKTCWLAFCSGSFLKEPGRKIPLPSDLWKELIDAPHGFPDVTTNFPDELGLPQSIKQFANTNQTVFQYQVHESTNVLGWSFPLEFYLVHYVPDHTNGWQIELTVKGRVTAIGPGKQPEIPPEVFNYVQK